MKKGILNTDPYLKLSPCNLRHKIQKEDDNSRNTKSMYVALQSASQLELTSNLREYLYRNNRIAIAML